MMVADGDNSMTQDQGDNTGTLISNTQHQHPTSFLYIILKTMLAPPRDCICTIVYYILGYWATHPCFHKWEIDAF